MNQRPVQNRWLKAVGTAACLVAVLATLGGHWMALQSFAWARMIGHYAREGSLASAISKTFDGRHPCTLCHIIQNGSQQEQRDPKSLPCLRLGEGPDLLCDLRQTAVPLPLLMVTFVIPFVPGSPPAFIPSPPKPPPRPAADAR